MPKTHKSNTCYETDGLQTVKEVKRPTIIPRRDLVTAQTSYEHFSQTNGLSSKKLKQFTYDLSWFQFANVLLAKSTKYKYGRTYGVVFLSMNYLIISLPLSISKYILPLQQTSPIYLFLPTNQFLIDNTKVWISNGSVLTQ